MPGTMPKSVRHRPLPVEEHAVTPTDGRFAKAIKILAAVLLVASLTCIAVGVGWAFAKEAESEGTLPPGVTIGGYDVSGMSRGAAVGLLVERLTPLVDRTIETRVETATYSLDVDDYLNLDIDRMIRDVYALREQASFYQRMSWAIFGDRLDLDLPVRSSVDEAALREWLREIAFQIESEVVEATRTVGDDGGYEIVQPQDGHRLPLMEALCAIRESILTGVDEVTLNVEVVAPFRTGDDWAKTIVVDLSQRRLYLYDGITLEGEYGIAIGTPWHRTPRGDWKIISKRYMPSWGNPGSAWAASMPAYIPPGPSNPLGTRALNLNASGIRIHGTTQDWSIGRAASHGCMRMHRWDIEDLYDRVEVGTPVIITD